MMDPNEELEAYRRDAKVKPDCGCNAGWSVVVRDGERVGVCTKCHAEKREEKTDPDPRTFDWGRIREALTKGGA